MRARVVYIKGHEESEKQARQAFNSFKLYDWDVKVKAGLTKETVNHTYKIIEESRLLNFEKENKNRYYTKLACAYNHIDFWHKVIEEDEPMAFIEHDAICTMEWNNEWDFEDYLILNAEWVFRPPNKLALQQFRNYDWPSFGVNDMPSNYPLQYYRENVWKDSMMAPGTGAYAITPQGAKKMLEAIEMFGMDQSDFMINSFNVRMQYLLPSPIKFNTVNLSTSYGL